MAADTILPDDDRDLILAREIGLALEQGSSFEALDDALIPALAEFKNSELDSYADYSLSSDTLWDRIAQQTKPRARILPLYQRPAVRAWAAAAVVLIAAFIGFWWVSLDPSPQLVAQSDSAIQVIQLEDGTEVTLRPYTQLFEETLDETHRSYSLAGEAFFDVVSDPDRPFAVNAGSGTVTVLGTRFNLSSWGDQTRVYLEEGSVQFNTEDQRSIVLEPGQSSSIIAGNLSEAEFTEADQFTDWINNMLVFSDTPPAEVVAEIGQHFNINITISELEDQEGLDGTLRLDSIDQTLEDLGLVLGGTFRKTADDTYTFTPMD
jgi:transmembrane sensor